LGIRSIPANWRLRAAPLPALRRGLLVAIPVGLTALIDLQLDSPVAGGLSTGALLAGFIAFDAPARTRLVWQLLVAPVIGGAAALGALTSSPGALAALTMAVFACLAGLTVAVSLRLAIAGMMCTLALLLAQGFELHPRDAVEALIVGVAGALSQALLSALVSLREEPSEPRPRPVAGCRDAARTVRDCLDLQSPSLRHALRWGIGLGLGVALYHVIDLGPHGYWIPLTVLFVLKPGPAETNERIAMRAAGTLAGLLLATGLAELLGLDAVANAAVLTLAAACSFALLLIEYALFTTAITVYIVVLAHALGQGAFQAADERAIATIIGLVIAALGFVVFRDARVPSPSTAAP
jgi:fusaric acid resistance family protein